MQTLASFLPEGIGVGAALLLVVASFFTSALTAAFGVGGGVAMLALMGLFVPVAALIPVHGTVQLGSNTGRAWHQRAKSGSISRCRSSPAASSAPSSARSWWCSFRTRC